jgi:hypothetical protein
MSKYQSTSSDGLACIIGNMRKIILKLIAVSHVIYSTGYPRGVGMDVLYNFFNDFGTVSFVAVSEESAIIEFVEQ